jgi:hypothetical protein
MFIRSKRRGIDSAVRHMRGTSRDGRVRAARETSRDLSQRLLFGLQKVGHVVGEELVQPQGVVSGRDLRDANWYAAADNDLSKRAHSRQPSSRTPEEGREVVGLALGAHLANPDAALARRLSVASAGLDEKPHGRTRASIHRVTRGGLCRARDSRFAYLNARWVRQRQGPVVRKLRVRPDD